LSDVKRLVYPAVLALALVSGIAASWTAFGDQINNNAYDFFFRLYQPPPRTPDSILLAVDDASFQAFGGLVGMRKAFAAGLNRIRDAHPRVVAFDVTFADTGTGDDELEAAFSQTPHLILPCVFLEDGEHWSDPLPRFRRHAVVLGQVDAQLDKFDAVSREIPLEKATSRDRRWALGLEAYRESRGIQRIEESPVDLRVGDLLIPSKRSEGRPLLVRYMAIGGIPRVTLKQLADDPAKAELFRNKVVFAGVTDQTAVQDRRMTPLSDSQQMAGVEIHANVYETLARRSFLTDVSPSVMLLACLGIVLASGATFYLLDGWAANLLALSIFAFANFLPYWLFKHSLVFPYMSSTVTAGFAIAGSAAWRHLVVRRQLRQSESARERYQQAMQFVTHEMKTPLTAIQGSSELIGRYALSDEKRKQMAGLINAESKRLAGMIETFLSVERLSAGQMELKREPFNAPELLEKCVARVRPVAENKAIEISTAELPVNTLLGDRELMEYAFYNLLTNAVKYSPAKTKVTVYGAHEKGRVLVTVEDQGVGIAPKDARRIFEKFYRTDSAEKSGEKGTGIGLSIVEQIVVQHGGSISVASEVGKGSRFTISLPCPN
jgi:signal transduction histidine kinase